MEHHPIFERFSGYEGPRPAGQSVDLTGARFKGAWWGNPEIAAFERYCERHPALDEEYFEWCDLLAAVDAARGAFTMIELGAGYGRWGVRGAKAALQHGLTPHVVFVEAEPQHAAWIREALEMNGVSGSVIEAALAYDGVPVPFLIDATGYDAVNWYGQSRTHLEAQATEETYHGHTIHRAGQFGQILVPAITLEEVMDGLGVVDFIDADLQGAEREMILNSMPVLNGKCRRIHVGTHSEEIEDICRKAFTEAGWVKVWDFALQGDRDTPYGRCWFGDGVSSWINPRLETGGRPQ